MSAKLFLLLFPNNFASCAPKIVQKQDFFCKSVQIFRNTGTMLEIVLSLNNTMSNDGSSIEIIDQSHGD